MSEEKEGSAVEKEIVSYVQLREALEKLAEALFAAGACEEGVFKSKLVVSELVGNALKHGKDGKARLEYRIEGEIAELSVRSFPYFVPPEKSGCADVFSENGRGLFLVDECCDGRVFSDGYVRVAVKIK